MQIQSTTIASFDPEIRFIRKHFELEHDEKIEIESLRALFRYAAMKTPFTSAPDSAYIEMVAPAQFRLNLLQVYEKLFFEQEETYERNAVVATTILRDDADDIDQVTEKDPFSALRAGFSSELPRQISDIRKTLFACAGGFLKSKAELSAAEQFCMQANALEEIEEYNAALPAMSNKRRQDVMQGPLQYVLMYAKDECYMGQALRRKTVELSQRLYRAIPSPKQGAQIIALNEFRM